MFAPPLRRHRGHRPFDQLQQGLLHTLAGHVTSDGGIFGFAGDLVDFVDVDDAPLGLVDFVITLLQQLLDDVLHILAHITGLGEGGGVGDGEGHVQQTGEGLGHQGLAGTGGADEQNVALGQFHAGFVLRLGRLQTFVVVVDGDREDFLGPILADYVLIEDFMDFVGTRQAFAPLGFIGLLGLFTNNVVAQIHALVADEHRRSGDELADLVLALAAERAIQKLAAVGTLAALVFSHHAPRKAETLPPSPIGHVQLRKPIPVNPPAFPGLRRSNHIPGPVRRS